MGKKFLFFLFLAVLFIGLVSSIILPVPIIIGNQADAAEKVKLGVGVWVFPPNYLPIMAADEKGFWKDNGLEVESVAFPGGGPHMRAVAAGAIGIGLASTPEIMTAAGAGLPVVMVMERVSETSWNIWVKADSPYRHPRDLKGAKLGVTALGGVTHAFGRIILAAHGMERDVRFVAAGGVREAVAGLRAAGFEALVTSFGTVIDLKLAGILRDIAPVGAYLPKPWVENVVFVEKQFARSKPDSVRRMLKATVQAIDFVRRNPRWATDKIKGLQGVSEEAAKLIYDDVPFSATGKLDRKAVENVRKLFIEYGVVTEKAPAVDDLFTNEYLS